jgi:hypothetical protein
LAQKFPDLVFGLKFSEPLVGFAGAAFFEGGQCVAKLRYGISLDGVPRGMEFCAAGGVLSARGMQFCYETAIDALEAGRTS